ncbi:hypothetical protein F8388_018899 [Cannabis sativa]|uniref:RNase H type-1 domain-containing protein n=1 Tax=Cannabis sativa TaxID=3483 RepID=A0A7J6G2C9_CANSA|nr:hypothetical protein F8388_018899 [Cannabis sativa]
MSTLIIANNPHLPSSLSLYALSKIYPNHHFYLLKHLLLGHHFPSASADCHSKNRSDVSQLLSSPDAPIHLQSLSLASMASSSTTPNLLTPLSEEESLIHDFDHISISSSSDPNAFCLIFKLLSPRTAKPAWIERLCLRHGPFVSQPKSLNTTLGFFWPHSNVMGIVVASLKSNPGILISFSLCSPILMSHLPPPLKASDTLPSGFKPTVSPLVAEAYNWLKYTDSLRAPAQSHLKKNPFDISNATPFEELFPPPASPAHSLQHAVDQFLRVHSPPRTTTIVTSTCLSPNSAPPQPTHPAIPTPIMTTSTISHTAKGKGIAFPVSEPPLSRPPGIVIHESSTRSSPTSSVGTRKHFTRQSTQVGDSGLSHVQHSTRIFKPGASSPLFAEAQALYEGLNWCVASNLQPRFVFSDCLNLITKDNSSLSSLVQRIRTFLSSFPEATLLHVQRQHNDKAHSLAKLALRLRDED